MEVKGSGLGGAWRIGGGLQCRVGEMVCDCFYQEEAQRDGVSLNRVEQQIFDYWTANPDERQFWQDKVRRVVRELTDGHEAAFQLEADLWSYYVERSGVVPRFSEEHRHTGLARTSLRNLADYLIRLWTEPRPKTKRD